MSKKKLPPFQRARQPDQIEQRREAILHAALVLFQNNGLENVSLNDIAKKVGIAKSNIYRYFDCREHIYLRVVQRLASEWEARLYPRLEKLKGKGTVQKVAAILADVYMESEEYGELVSVVNSVLEKRLTSALVVEFRSAFLERRKRLARVLASAIPDMKFERIFPLTLHLFVHVPGLWPFCHPTLASRKMLEQPQFAHLNLDFRVEMQNFIQMLLKAASE
jgi:AcrR family transcriptional regulator